MAERQRLGHATQSNCFSQILINKQVSLNTTGLNWTQYCSGETRVVSWHGVISSNESNITTKIFNEPIKQTMVMFNNEGGGRTTLQWPTAPPSWHFVFTGKLHLNTINIHIHHCSKFINKCRSQTTNAHCAMPLKPHTAGVTNEGGKKNFRYGRQAAVIVFMHITMTWAQDQLHYLLGFTRELQPITVNQEVWKNKNECEQRSLSRDKRKKKKEKHIRWQKGSESGWWIKWLHQNPNSSKMTWIDFQISHDAVPDRGRGQKLMAPSSVCRWLMGNGVWKKGP